jgi:hypothetical protein
MLNNSADATVTPAVKIPHDVALLPFSANGAKQSKEPRATPWE